MREEGQAALGEKGQADEKSEGLKRPLLLNQFAGGYQLPEEAGASHPENRATDHLHWLSSKPCPSVPHRKPGNGQQV